MRFFPVIALLLLASAPAQGVLPLSETYTFGEIGSEFFGCGPASTPDVYVGRGSFAFDPNGTFEGFETFYSVCVGGTLATTGETFAGVYQVRTDGRVILDDIPEVQGWEVERLHFRSDGTVVILTREDVFNQDGYVGIAVALSSGQSNASLDGPYRIARMVQRNDAATLSVRTERGEVVFDGVGGYLESGVYHSVALGGFGVDEPYGPIVGSYSVDPDGALTVGAGIGGMSPDGEIFFYTRNQGQDVELTVGVRQRPAPTYIADLVRGDWGVTIMGNLIGDAVLPGGPYVITDSATFTFSPLTSTSGTFSTYELLCETDIDFTDCYLEQFNGLYTMDPDGSMGLDGPSGALSADGSCFIGTVDPPEGAMLVLALSRARWPTPIGNATPGSGGRLPEITPVGGFPYAGNADFTLVMNNGLGSAPGALVFSSDAVPPPGISMFGGTVWLDPFGVFASIPVTLSGPAGVPGVGAAGVPIPIPDVPALGGARFFLQGVMIDPGAPASFAMTRGLELMISR